MKIKVSLILALTVLFHFAAFCMEEKNMLKSSYAD